MSAVLQTQHESTSPVADASEAWLLPFNSDAEQAVLGSIVIDSRSIERVTPILRPDQFYLPAHAAIFRAMLVLHEEGVPADIVTLIQRLEECGDLDEVGGLAYLSALAQRTPTSLNVEHYARIVERLWEQRQLALLGQRMLAGDVDIDAAQREIDTLRSLRSAEGASQPTPDLDPMMVPGPLRERVVEIARRNCTPLGWAAAATITAVSGVVGRSLGINPDENNETVIVPNLWGFADAPPGAMKTPTVNAAMWPLRKLEAIARQRYQEEERASAPERQRLEAEIEGIKAAMKHAASKRSDDQVEELSQRLEAKMQELEEKRVVQVRYRVADTTTEKLLDILAQNPTGVTLYHDELSGPLRAMEKPGREGDREIYLGLWNGDGEMPIDRITRGSQHVDGMCLAIFGSVQPAKLERYIRDSVSHNSGDDGLLQRFQLAIYTERYPQWRRPTDPPSKDAKNRVFRVFEALSQLSDATSGMYRSDSGVPYVQFTREAQQVWNEWRDDLEQRLRSGQMARTPAFAAHLAKYRSLIPSLALLFWLIDLADQGRHPDASSCGRDTCHGSQAWCHADFPRVDAESREDVTALHRDSPTSFAIQRVPLDALELAIEWGEFLEAHARRIYAPEFPGTPEDTPAPRPTRQRVIDSIRAAGKPLRPLEVATALSVSGDTARQLCRRMTGNGQLVRNVDGTYDIAAGSAEGVTASRCHASAISPMQTPDGGVTPQRLGVTGVTPKRSEGASTNGHQPAAAELAAVSLAAERAAPPNGHDAAPDRAMLDTSGSGRCACGHRYAVLPNGARRCHRCGVTVGPDGGRGA